MGDSYDNAMAEAFNSLYKAELVRNKGPWRGLDDLEIATVEYIDWYNNRRLHGELGAPPARRARGSTRDDPPGHRNPGNQITQSPSNPGLDTQDGRRPPKQVGDNSIVRDTDAVAAYSSHSLPSPLDEVPHPVFVRAGVRVLLKREDTVDPLIGGNKWRKLKYNLIQTDLSGYGGIVTFGGPFSNHLVAVAEAGSRQGLPTIGYVRDTAERPSAFTSMAHDLGMSLSFVSRDWFRLDRAPAFMESIGSRHPGFLVIPEGGSNRLGLKGVAEIIAELPECETICCPCGTGGTVAGLVMGLKGRSKVLGVAAWRGKGVLEQDIDDMLVESEVLHRNYEITYSYHGGGFGRVNEDLVTMIRYFREANGLWLDARFTGKMMLALLGEARSGRFAAGSTIVALHTGLPATNDADEQLWNTP